MSALAPVPQRFLERVSGAPEERLDALRGADERQPAQHRPPVAALVARGAGGGNQAAVLVEAQRGLRDSAAVRDLSDGQQGG